MGEFPHDVYDAVLAFLKQSPRKESTGKKSAAKRRAEEPLTLTQALALVDGSIADFESSYENCSAWHAAFYNYEAMEGVREVISNAQHCVGALDGCALSLLALRCAFGFMSTHDDSDGDASDAVDQCFDVLGQCAEELSDIGSSAERSLVA